MNKKYSRRIIGSIIGIAMVVGGLLTWSYVKSTPQYFLWQFKHAVLSKDYKSTVEFFDTKKVADNSWPLMKEMFLAVMQDVMAEQMKQIGDNPFAALGYQMGMAMAAPMIEGMRSDLENSSEAICGTSTMFLTKESFSDYTFERDGNICHIGFSHLQVPNNFTNGQNIPGDVDMNMFNMFVDTIKGFTMEYNQNTKTWKFVSIDRDWDKMKKVFTEWMNEQNN